MAKFGPDNPGNSPGRPKGSKNALRGAHGDLILAWDRASGPETALEIMRTAVAQAKEGNFEGLRTVLPFIARKMPDTIEMVDKLAGATPEQLKAIAQNVVDNLAEDEKE